MPTDFGLGCPMAGSDELATDERVARAEIEMVEALRRAVAPLIAEIPSEPDGFIAWFEQLRHTGPGQGDPLFPWSRPPRASSK